MYKASQQLTMWSHVLAVVLSQRALDKGIAEIKNSLFRFRDIRYVPWVFGTNEPIDSLFSKTGMFGKSAMNSPRSKLRGISRSKPCSLRALKTL